MSQKNKDESLTGGPLEEAFTMEQDPDPDFPEVVVAHGHKGGSPFDSPVASAYSCYSGIIAAPENSGDRRSTRLYKVPRGSLWPEAGDDRVKPPAQLVHDQLRAFILSESYPCLGSRIAFSKGTYRFGFYRELAHENAVLAMGRDLRRFVSEYEQLGDFCSFIAAFKYPGNTSETSFEKALWQHLQKLHDADDSAWDPHYSCDPATGNFGFSFAGCAFFVVGMHSGASRLARRFAYPLLVFNPESQIRRLKEAGELERFVAAIRQRDIRLQGSINPALPTDGNTTGGEARVYSGAPHKPGKPWRCPFKPKPGSH